MIKEKHERNDKEDWNYSLKMFKRQRRYNDDESLKVCTDKKL